MKFSSLSVMMVVATALIVSCTPNGSEPTLNDSVHAKDGSRAQQSVLLTTKKGESLQVEIVDRTHFSVGLRNTETDEIWRLPIADFDSDSRTKIHAVRSISQNDYPIRASIELVSGETIHGSLLAKGASFIQFRDEQMHEHMLHRSQLAATFWSKIQNYPEVRPKFPFEMQLVTNDQIKIDALVRAKNSKSIGITDKGRGIAYGVLLEDLPKETTEIFNEFYNSSGPSMVIYTGITDKQGVRTNALILGKNEHVVKIRNLDEDLTYCIALESLSDSDLIRIRRFGGRAKTEYPVLNYITDIKGRTMGGFITGRSPDVFIFKKTDSNQSEYYLLAGISDFEQNQIRDYPENIETKYPIVSVLSDNQGRSIDVRILGRNDNDLKLSLLGSSKIFFYKIGDLSPESSQAVRKLPANLDEHARYMVDSNIQSWAEEIELLKGQIGVLKSELSTDSASRGPDDLIEQKIEEKERFIAQLELRIKEKIRELKKP